ncbi:hypothetical protein [Paraburkholderia tropica]|uniref:hypothetical protein n=1 Tax=Paraburkholderia tropica TaxID=92647 RepID=UPI002AB79F4D|nr:hypothetical protein [Paraburkholderia tropica]
MPIKKDYETPATGAIASYHVSAMVTLDAISKATSITVQSFLSADARAAGKSPMYQQQVMISSLPESGADVFAFADAQLVAAPPSDDAAALNPARYAFTGAEIVD